jgi:NAD-dependent DNA ligase
VAKKNPPDEAGDEKDKAKGVPSVDVLGSTLQTLMQDAAAKFVKDNATDVAKLGEDVVRAIFAQQFMATMPALLKLPDNATVEMRLESEENNAVRTEIAQVIAKAERENAASVARVRGNASSMVGKAVGGVLTAVFTFAAKAFLGA